MSEKNRNRKTSLSDFIRYRRIKMSDEERNAFERELQKDPFAEEAAEGFEAVTPEEAERDLLSIKRRLTKRTTRKKRFIYYRIAASVAVLMVISSIFIVVERNKPEERPPYTSQGLEEMLIAESRPVVKPDVDMERTEKFSEPKEAKSAEPPAKQEIQAVAAEPLRMEQEKAAREEAADTHDAVREKKAEVYITNDQLIVPVAAMAKGRKVAAVDQISKSDSVKEELIPGYIPPEPLTGKENFDKYLQESIRRPDTITSGQRVVVVLDFKVLTNGTIDSIRVLKSPDKIFSDEAIRLIREGPAWKPAMQEGKRIDDNISVRIVFQ